MQTDQAQSATAAAAPPPVPGNHGAFDVETDRGKRLIEFDPDVFRSRDVRVLVDGTAVATMPYPKAGNPYEQVSFDLDGFALVAASWLPPDGANLGMPVFDLYSNGRSLTDGSTLADRTSSSSTPRPPYPRSFMILDVALRVGPAAAGPGIAAALGRNAGPLGLARTITVAMGLIGVLVLATSATAVAWRRIKADERRSVRERAAWGWAALVLCFGGALLLVAFGAASIRT